jgi:hypothetical protein
MLLMAACLPLTLSTLPGQPTHRSCLLGYGALVLIANNASADSRIHRIKQESASLRLERRLQTPQRHRPRRDSPCTSSLSMMQKPVYPPTYAERAVFSVSSNASDGKDSALGGKYSNAEAFQREVDSVVLSPTCACQENVYDLQQKVSQIEHECTALSRRLLRLETLPKALVQAFLTSDDITLMDRYACSAVVYNEELTTKRPLRRFATN